MDKTGKLNYIELGIDDMTNLVELSDESLLYNLQTRYGQKIIYTYIGSILISINPYTELGIYDQKQISRYQNKSMQDVPPHLFGIAEINYSKMIMENENQVIVISGESGAGKTEAFKRILRYLAFTSGGVKEVNLTDRDLSNDIANKILDSTPLLESFGNAKTIRNDNSSRFGKYVEIFFDNGIICSSRTTNYLLEKSRIVSVNPDERGYHIFYELLQGLDSFGKSQYYFKNVADYAYLNNAKTFSVKDRDDAANLKQFMCQWSTLGLTNEDLDVAMRIVSAVLHLGNIKFREEDDSSFILEQDNVNVVAKMLKVDCQSLINCLTMKTTDTVKDIASSPVNAEQAANLRDTLAKHLYSELFDWIVIKVNESLNEKTAAIKRTASHLDRSMNSSSSKLRCIAMLDIYGFENFPENSLEQLCINYANETLQQFFNRYVFELEQAEYKQEGISWHYITYPDNQPIIDLLSAKPSGVIQILNDECSIPQGSDAAFLTKCHNVHQKNANFEKPKKVHPPQFVIKHFAGNIFYNVTGFLDKNRDIIRKEAIRLIENCGVDQIALMFRKKKEKALKNPNIKARTPAVMADFQNSLATLLNKMKTCQPWFIRCLKPNNKKQPLAFDNDIVMDQMRYTGILETVKIRKSGFPIRIVFSLFLSRFYLLQSKEMRRFAKKEPQEACLKMMPKYGGLKGKDFEVGRTKLFLKEHFARHLESQVRVIREKSAIKIQRQWRAYWKIREIIIKNRAATKLQAIVRGFLDRRRIKKLHVAIIKLQAYVRMHLVRVKFIEDHPEFLKYAFNKIDSNASTKSTAMAYKFPDVEVSRKTKNIKDKKNPILFNYNMLKIPKKLAFLLDRSTEDYGQGHAIPTADSITQTGRAQHLYNRDEYKLPDNINDYSLDEFIEEFGNNVSLESKTRPITNPFLKDNMSPDTKDDCLNAHKLILRLIYVDSMSWFHRYLAGSFLSYMASSSPQLQMEILIQIIAETIDTKSKGYTLGRNNNVNDVDYKRISRAWTLLGNMLCHVIPVPEIFKYILQYVSVSFGIDQACTCQEKLLQFVNDDRPKIPRLLPASNLEWRANSRGSKTSLKAHHADGVHNSVHVNSFTTAENFGNHSICFRLKRFRLNKGWSISIVTEDSVIDCSGHNYVFDVISALELTDNWANIIGYGIEHKFLISKKGAGSTNLEFIQANQQNKYPHGSVNKSKGTMSSRKSMDSWVDKYFDKSFRNEETSNTRVEDFIHGLEDDILAQRQLNQNPGMNPALNPSMGAPGILTPQSAYHYNPQAYGAVQPSFYYPNQPDRRYLEEQLNSVELQNKVIKSSIENEMLQKQLQDLRHQGTMQIPTQQPQFLYQPQQSFNTSTYPMQGNQFMMREQFMQPANFQNQHIPHNFAHSDSFSSPGQHNGVNDSSNISTPDGSHGAPKYTSSIQTKRRAPELPTPPSPPPLPIDGKNLSSSAQIDKKPSIVDQERTNNLKKKKSVIKYSDISPPTNVVVDDSTILPQVTKNEIHTKSQLRAAEIPKVNVANRARFLEKFFEDKNLQTPQTSKVKRTAPMAPMSPVPKPALPSVSEAAHVPAPPPLIPQPRLIPRPSIFQRTKPLLATGSESSTLRNTLEYDSQVLHESHDSIDRPVILPTPEIKKRRKRMVSSSKSAVILSGLPDMRYYTYTKSTWYPLVKIELFLPKEIQDSTILKTVIFCQIVRDLTEFPCIRWLANERKELLLMIGNIRDVTDLRSLLNTPSNVILNVIDRAQTCELYFSRFYSIQWLSTNANGQICHWLSISHSGMRFVEQNTRRPELGLKIVTLIPYSKLMAINGADPDLYNNPQRIIIKTRSNNSYEFISSNAMSIMDLVREFVGEEEDPMKAGSSSVRDNNALSTRLYGHKKTKRKLLKDNEVFKEPSPELMTLGVNNQRILVKNFFEESGNPWSDKHPSIDNTGDLIDFMLCYSKHKSKDDVANFVLKWQMQAIKEPMLPSLNSKLLQRALDLFQSILVLSGNTEIEARPSLIDCGISVFKTMQHTRELLEEIVIQIMKQINGNSKSNNRQILWNLLSTVIIFFGVSKRMEPFLLQHLKHMVQDKSNPDNNAAHYALKNTKKVMTYGIRKEMPLQDELKHLLNGGRNASITVCIPRSFIDCKVTFNNTVDEVIKLICQTFDITTEQEIAEYSIGLVEINENQIPTGLLECLKRESYLYDSINYLSRKQKLNFIYYFSRSSWIMPLNPSKRSPKLVNMTFNQMSKDVLGENWTTYHGNDTKFLKTVTAIAYFNLRGQGYDKPINEEILRSILPNYLLTPNKESISKAELIKMINSTPSIIDITAMEEQVDFQRKFIELVTQLPRFGWIQFPILRLSHIPSSNNVSINFTPKNITILNESTKENILKITLSSLTSFQVTKLDTTAAQFTVRYSGIQEIQFTSGHLSELAFLLDQYLNIRSLMQNPRS